MRPADNMDKLFKKLRLKASARLDDRVHSDIARALEKCTKTKSAVMQPNVWRIIMKSRIAKLAAAAAVIVAVGLMLTVFDKSLSSAYAIEQTIQAMRSIHSVHAYCTDWDNSKGETWVQIDPNTGQEEYYYADQGNLLIVGSPQATYYYYKDKNLVRIRDEYVPASDVRISRFFEDMVNWVQQYHGELRFYHQFDEELQKEVIMVHVSVPAQEDMGEHEVIVRVDSQTKLPINFEAIKSAPGQGVKSVDRIEYNLVIPEGIFEFVIPDGAKVVHEGKDQGAG